MAKKKVVSKPSSNGSELKENLLKNSEQEKMASLQTLNNLLVRETMELREHVNGLRRSKEMFVCEKQSLEAEKNRYKKLYEEQSEMEKGSELEQSINRVFIASQISEQEEKWKKQVEEMERLLIQEAEMGSCYIQKFEKTEVEKMELESLVSVLENKLDVLMREKEDKEKLHLEQEVVILELQKQIDDLERVVNQEKEVNMGLNQKLADFELAMKEKKELKTLIIVFERKLQDLMKEKGDKERVCLKQELHVAELQKQMGHLERRVDEETELNSCLNQKLIEFELVKKEKKEVECMVSVFQTKLEDLIREVEEKESLQIIQEEKIAELKEKVNKASTHVSAMQESCKDLTETKHRLEEDLNVSREASNRVVCERDSFQKELELKEGEIEGLRTAVAELEKKKKEIVEKHEGLKLEKDLAQRAVVESSERFQQVFLMVKKAGENVCRCEDRGEIGFVAEAKGMEEEIQLFAAELEAIVGAFRRRVGEIEKMNQKMENLQELVEEKEKKRSFWAWVSSATGFFAASVVAYVTKWS